MTIETELGLLKIVFSQYFRSCSVQRKLPRKSNLLQSNKPDAGLYTRVRRVPGTVAYTKRRTHQYRTGRCRDGTPKMLILTQSKTHVYRIAIIVSVCRRSACTRTDGVGFRHGDDKRNRRQTADTCCDPAAARSRVTSRRSCRQLHPQTVPVCALLYSVIFLVRYRFAIDISVRPL